MPISWIDHLQCDLLLQFRNTDCKLIPRNFRELICVNLLLTFRDEIIYSFYLHTRVHAHKIFIRLSVCASDSHRVVDMQPDMHRCPTDSLFLKKISHTHSLLSHCSSEVNIFNTACNSKALSMLQSNWRADALTHTELRLCAFCPLQNLKHLQQGRTN